MEKGLLKKGNASRISINNISRTADSKLNFIILSYFSTRKKFNPMSTDSDFVVAVNEPH
jgi:hypothetical protein